MFVESDKNIKESICAKARLWSLAVGNVRNLNEKICAYNLDIEHDRAWESKANSILLCVFGGDFS